MKNNSEMGRGIFRFLVQNSVSDRLRGFFERAFCRQIEFSACKCPDFSTVAQRRDRSGTHGSINQKIHNFASANSGKMLSADENFNARFFGADKKFGANSIVPVHCQWIRKNVGVRIKNSVCNFQHIQTAQY